MSTIFKFKSLILEARCIDGGTYYDLWPLEFMIYMQALEWISEGA